MSTPAVQKHSWRHADICQPHSPTHSSIAPRTQSSLSSGMEEHHHHHHYHHHHHHHHSIPRIILDHISAKSPKRAAAVTGSEKNQITVPESTTTIMRTAKYSANKLQISRRAQSVPDPPKKNISSYFRTYSQHSGNFLSPKTRKKPMLTRTEAIDESYNSGRSSASSSTGSSQVYKNTRMGKMPGDIRSHLFMSFFTRHFGKMHRKISRRPLGASSSCDLEVRQEKNLLRCGHVSEDSNSPYSLALSNHPNQLHSGLNCFHCLIDISSRERELTKEPQKMAHLSSSFDCPSMKGTATLCNTSQNSNINCKLLFRRDDSSVINAGISPSVANTTLNNRPVSTYFTDVDHHFLSSSLLPIRKLYGSSDCLTKRHQDTNRASNIQRTKSLNSLKNYKNDSTDMLSSFTSTASIMSSTASSNIELRVSAAEDSHGRALAKSPVARRVAAAQSSQSHETTVPVCKHRTKNYWFDSKIHPDEHIWLPSSGLGTAASSSRDTECYVGERDCRKIGEKQSCAACRIVAHTACLPLLRQLHMKCKVTYQEGNAAKKQQQQLASGSASTDGLLNRHHWVHRWKHEGRCLRCGKSFQQKIFRDKEVIAITCTWCKRSYHNKVECFSSHCFDGYCDRGDLKEVIIPPTWIQHSNPVKTRKSKDTTKRRRHRPFTVRPIPLDDGSWTPSQPLLVFVNPKSGGNKGSKLLNTFCWLLNPRQVFDITTFKGPEFGLDIFKKVASSLRVLVCGGDGTVGWVLSTLDKMKWTQIPPIGIVPLGTGNDLARFLGWGGSFNEEPLVQLLSAVIYETSITHLDRWNIKVEANFQCSSMQADEIDEAAQGALPLTVMNNYYSIGADAHVALQFHQSRSANPQMLNSRLKNRIAYGGLGTIDLFKRTWKLLHEYITLECDGVDLTSKIKELKFHCILFHNITYYAGGTVPWSNENEEIYRPTSYDGKLEVLGFTTATLAALQMGGKGERIAQCSHARITTTKAIPMQVDGEPCLLAPSTIEITFHSQVPMLRREKKSHYTPASLRRQSKISKQQQSGSGGQVPSTPVKYSLPILITGSTNYHANRDQLERLKEAAVEIGRINVEAEAELESVRQKIEKLLADCTYLDMASNSDWRFLDYVSSAEEGVFRVHRYQEQFSTLSDISCLDECIMILDNGFVKPIQHKSSEPSSQLGKNISYDDICSNGDTLHITFRSDTQEAHL